MNQILGISSSLVEIADPQVMLVLINTFGDIAKLITELNEDEIVLRHKLAMIISDNAKYLNTKIIVKKLEDNDDQG